MKLAPISAPQWADKIQRGDYHMVIAPWLYEIPGYAQYYNSAARPKGTYVMLDNGSWEGYDITPEQLCKAAAIARAVEVTLPDVLGEGAATLQKAYKAIPTLQEDAGITGLMFVPQGETLDEWLRCRDAWLDRWRKDGLAARFDLCWGLMSTRRGKNWRYQAIPHALETGHPVHLLGLSDVRAFVRRELPLCEKVRGIDTSLPFALACARQLLTPDSPKIPLQKPHHYAALGQWTMTRAYLNVLILRDWLAKGTASREIPIGLIRRAAGRSRKISANPQHALRCCRVPPGQYVIRHLRGQPQSVWPLGRGEKTRHEIVGVYYG